MNRKEAIALLMNISAYDIDNKRGLQKQEAIEMAIKALRQPEQKWIPVSDGLPEDVENMDGVPNPTVLFCTSKKVYMGYYSHGARCWWTVDGYSICEVIAWMPLPTSYSAPTHEQEGETNVR